MSTGQVLQDRVVLLLTNGMTVGAAESYCQQQGQDPETAGRTVAEARKRITIAAEYARDEQLGKAITRLDSLYATSIAARDTRTALQAQRELNRLLSLYSAAEAGGKGAEGDGDEAARRLELIASYLLPLKLVEEGYPVEEHARVAAEIIRTNGLGGVSQG